MYGRREPSRPSPRRPSQEKRPGGRILLATVLGAMLLASPAGGSAAHAAHLLNVLDEAHLHFTKGEGSTITDEGHATGTFPGTVKAHFTYNGEPTVQAQFTIYGPGGSISAHGTGRLSSLTSPDPSFHGIVTVAAGTGRYGHIHGRGELYGVLNRRTFGVTVQAIGKLSY
jgi:predicted dehydrogenase